MYFKELGAGANLCVLKQFRNYLKRRLSKRELGQIEERMGMLTESTLKREKSMQCHFFPALVVMRGRASLLIRSGKTVVKQTKAEFSFKTINSVSR